MDKQELEKYIALNYTFSKLAEHFGVSQSTIRHWMKKYGLKTNNKRYNNAGHYKFKSCKCGESNPNNFFKKKGDRAWHICKACYKLKYGRMRLERVHKVKEECVAYLGGKCSKCGYDKCIAALEYHHKNPEQKDPNWKKMRLLKLEKIKEELDKCVLLCSNCHKEEHWILGPLGESGVPATLSR